MIEYTDNLPTECALRYASSGLLTISPDGLRSLFARIQEDHESEKAQAEQDANEAGFAEGCEQGRRDARAALEDEWDRLADAMYDAGYTDAENGEDHGAYADAAYEPFIKQLVNAT